MMDELGEIEMRILSELEEAGEEDMITLVNTVMPRRGSTAELDEFAQSLERLIGDGLAIASVRQGPDGRLDALDMQASLEEVSKIPHIARFDETIRRWVDNRVKGPPFGESFPFVLNTSAGKAKGFEILDARGYQWWISK